MFKRVGLFLLTNILVLVTISIITSLLGVNRYFTAQGIDYNSLMVFCLIWGMGGAFISLWMSKFMVKMAMGVKIISPNESGQMGRLVHIVHGLARKAGLKKMPEVGYYRASEVNAFATGPSKNNSLVAVSTGLLESMDGDALEGVLGHEVAHIANGDMVTMTLIQGIINAFVLFFAKIVAWTVANFMRGDEESGPSFIIYFLVEIAFTIIFSILGSVVVMAFSRWREYHADEGGATIAGRGKMIHALESLRHTLDRATTPGANDHGVATLKISNKPSGFAQLFSSHPSLESRIAKLKAKY